MKVFTLSFLAISILILFSATAVLAQSFISPKKEAAVSTETANNYYASCMAKPDPVLGDEDQQATCACMAAQLKGYISPDDLEIVTQDTPSGRAAWNKMLVYVFAPCVSYTVAILDYQNCQERSGYWPMVKDLDAFCSCKAKLAGTYIAEEGPLVLDRLTKYAEDNKLPTITDPVEALMGSIEYRRKQSELFNQCVQR